MHNNRSWCTLLEVAREARSSSGWRPNDWQSFALLSRCERYRSVNLGFASQRASNAKSIIIQLLIMSSWCSFYGGKYMIPMSIPPCNSAAWWRHQMETFSALLALCAGNSPVTGEFLAQRPVTRNIDVFFDLRLKKQSSKQSRRRWFEKPPRSLWRHCNEHCMVAYLHSYAK